MRKWIASISLIKRGARHQIAVATALVAILPMLVICYLALRPAATWGRYPVTLRFIIVTILIVLSASGYAMLLQYPRNIVKLRHCLERMTAGDLPKNIELAHSEDDIIAIEHNMNMVLTDLHAKVCLLQEQLNLTREMNARLESNHAALLDAERQRVMLQSLGAACHHIGQPATLICAHIELLKLRAKSPEELAEIEECKNATDAIFDVIARLRCISEYRTVPYLTPRPGEDPEKELRILDIGYTSASGEVAKTARKPKSA